MVALCSNHAAKADNGSYPDDYFNRLKAEGRGRAAAVQGQFDYLRRDLWALIGSNFYHDVDTILEVDGRRSIYFNRDSDGYLLLNFTLPGANGSPRAWLEDNVWLVPPGAQNIDCPPRGRYLAVTFENGDMFRVQYSDIGNADEFLKKFPGQSRLAGTVTFPITVAQFWERASGVGIELGRLATTLPGDNKFSGGVITGGRVGISVQTKGHDPRIGMGQPQILAQALRDFYS